MKQEFGKYNLRYAWFPTKLDNGSKIWFENYYRAYFDLPMVESVYTTSNISTVDYLVECIKGTIVDGKSTDWGFRSVSDRMLNANKSLLPIKGSTDEELQ